MTWRIVQGPRVPPHAHYFEAPDRPPLCRTPAAWRALGVSGLVRGPWTAHEHAGRVKQCPACRAWLLKPRSA